MFQSNSSSPSESTFSSSPIQPAQKPLLPNQANRSGGQSLQRSLSNLSISSRYSYDNIDQNGDTFQETLPSFSKHHMGMTKNNKRTYIQQNAVQADTISTNSSTTLRTDSYRQAHPLQSYAFDYPKRPLLGQPKKSNGHDNRQKLNGSKHYEISV